VPKTVSRREFVGAAIAGAVAVTVPNIAQSRSERPNILFILADDLGYGDLSCYGRPDYRTPNLDRLATQGVRFANAYSASPLCTPSRCALITGRYPARTRVGLEEPLHEKRALGERVMTLGLPSDHPTIASLLRQAGYDTALIGKWHLGYLPKFGPVQSGFDEFFGCMSGAIDHFTHKDMEGDPDLFDGEMPVERPGYMTDLLTARAVKYIQRRKNSTRPFYLSLHYTAPHWPWEGPGDQEPNPELRGPVAFRGGGSLKTYAAMMKSLDDGIGNVLQALARAGLERNTLVVFTSDNGGERFSYHWPLTGQKNSLWEGGIRVPAIVRGPGLVSTKNIIADPIITMDWTATILAAAKAKPHPDYPIDGEDLLPRIRSRSAATARTFFWRHSNQAAALKGPWKYLNDGTREYLFNLSVDQREQANFRDQNPAMFDLLRNDFKKWESTVLPRPSAPPR
jgi:arylsulfatase A-like enzyme